MATTDQAASAERPSLLPPRSDPFVRLARVGASWTRGLGNDGALLLGGGLLLALICLGTIVRLFWTADPNAVSLDHALASPSLAHPMGTDDNGRDLFARFNE